MSLAAGYEDYFRIGDPTAFADFQQIANAVPVEMGNAIGVALAAVSS